MTRLCGMAGVLTSLILFQSCQARGHSAANILPGADVLLADSLHLVLGKRVGIVCNHTSLLSTGEHLIDALVERRVNVVALFSPEHGISGQAAAGEYVVDTRRESIPVLSLYGKTRKPTGDMLKGMDVLVFDLQDVGSRFYTYVSTLGYCMEAAAEAGLPVIVLDRPNPINGMEVEGPVHDTTFRSFVGMYPVPVRHGMTIGEMARMIQGERWMKRMEELRLVVIPMKHWRRNMWYDETGLLWVPPSPNIPDLETALLYAGMCLFEGTTVSEGRGTDTPFRTIGSPSADADAIVQALDTVAGVKLRASRFVPRRRSTAMQPKFEGKECRGVRLDLTDRTRVRPVAVALELLYQFQMNDPHFKSLPFLDRLDRTIARSLLKDIRFRQTASDSWVAETDQFTRIRERYLLYEPARTKP